MLTRDAIRTALNPSPDVGTALPPALRALADSGLEDQVELIKITPRVPQHRGDVEALDGDAEPLPADRGLHGSVVLIESHAAGARAAAGAQPRAGRRRDRPRPRRGRRRRACVPPVPMLDAVVPPAQPAGRAARRRRSICRATTSTARTAKSCSPTTASTSSATPLRRAGDRRRGADAVRAPRRERGGLAGRRLPRRRARRAARRNRAARDQPARDDARAADHQPAARRRARRRAAPRASRSTSSRRCAPVRRVALVLGQHEFPPQPFTAAGQRRSASSIAERAGRRTTSRGCASTASTARSSIARRRRRAFLEPAHGDRNERARTRADWTEANQRAAGRRVRAPEGSGSRGDGRRRGARSTSSGAARRCPRRRDRQLAERFGLSAFERDVLLLAPASRWTPSSPRCAQRAARRAAPCASFGLALAVLRAALERAHPLRPLRRWRLVETWTSGALVDRAPAHRRARAALPRRRQLPRSAPARRCCAASPSRRRWPRRSARSADAIVAGARSARRPAAGGPALRRRRARPARRRGARRRALRPAAAIVLARRRHPAAPHELEALATLWDREAALLDGALLVECGDGGRRRRGARASSTASRGLVFVAAREPVTRVAPRRCGHRVDKPDRGRPAAALASRRSAPAPTRLERRARRRRRQFRLSARDIQRAGAASRALLPRRAPDDALWQACRALGAPRGSTSWRSASSRPPAGTTSSCPSRRRARCGRSPCHVRHRLTVYERWGFAGEERARPRHQRAVRRRERHRQDDGRRGAGQRARPRSLPHRPLRGGQQVHRRDREEPRAACSTPPRTAARSCCSTRPTRCSASAARSRTATTATPTSR